MSLSKLLAAGLLSGTWVASMVQAQTARSGGAPNAQLMQQMQQLASERTSLQAENGRLKKDLEDMRKERDTLKSGQKAVDARLKNGEAALRQSTAQRESAEQEVQKSKEKMEQLIAKFRETVQTLREIEADRNSTRQTLAARDVELKSCVDHNKTLYKIDDEVLTRLENQGMWSRVAASEPFTRLKRTQLENFADEYRARAKDEKLPEGAQTPGASSPKSTGVTTAPTPPATSDPPPKP